MTNVALNRFLFQYKELTNEVKNGKQREKLRVQFDRTFRQTGNRTSATLAILDDFIDEFDMEAVSLFFDATFEQLSAQHPSRKSWSNALKTELLEAQGHKCNNPRCQKHLATIHDCDFDHIIPFSVAFDTLGTMNLQVLCPECNQNKGDDIVKWAVNILANRIKEKEKKVIGSEDIVFEQQSFFKDQDKPDSSTLVNL